MIFFSGCDDAEPIPAYLHIANIDVSVSSDGTQGDNNDDIVDAWVFVDGQEVGTFELPATIPVLHSGSSVVTVLAGIKKNGLNSDRVVYPFYEAYEVTMELIPSEVDTLQPFVSYREGVTFPWLENFEDNSISLTGSGSGTTSDTFKITEDPEDVYNYDGVNNSRSGETFIGNGFQRWENSSVDQFDLPRIGQDIYLEINFKCNTEFVAGIYPINSPIVTGIPIVNFFSTVDDDGDMQWKKAYVSLKEDVNNPEFRNAEFKVFFYTQSSQGSSTKLFLDNIKLIHF